jgi:Tfp pilus assembly protein PilX
MKIRISNRQKGSILVLCLVICGLIGVILLSMMNMVSSDRAIIARGQSWNTAIPMCEAGIEDAMAHLNYAGTTNLASDGWTLSGTNYTRTFSFTDGYFSTTMSTSLPPVITTVGYVMAPVSTNYISRTVQVKTRSNGEFPMALLAKSTISMSGVSEIDSYNSTNSAYSTNGKWDPAKEGANAGIATLSSAANAITLNGGNVYGSVHTGPGGTVSTGKGAVGDVAYASSGGSGIEQGHVTADVNVAIPDVTVPLGLLSAPAPIQGAYTVGANTYSYMLGTADYRIVGDVNLNNGPSVVINGNARLYIVGSLIMAGSSTIYITPGSTLKLYIFGPTVDIKGSAIVNGAAGAPALTLYGLPTLTTMTYGGTSAFYGGVYAPEANFSFQGTTDFNGAAVANSFSMGGTMNVHYDEALGGPAGYKYLLTAWQEL